LDKEIAGTCAAKPLERGKPGNPGNLMNSGNLVINLNKPKFMSSQKAVTEAKKLFGARKAGHAGTLDPAATGVLIVCLNEATKVTRFLSTLDKEYIVRLKLGERTDTYDFTGRIIEKTDCPLLGEDKVRKVLNSFMGPIKQTPPMYSAIKIGGQPLYKLARRGLEVERPDRTVNIHQIDLRCFDLPYLGLRISCSKGTYIRTICDDIGKALGVGAHMVSLERTRVGIFGIDDSALIEELPSKKSACYSIDSAISHLNEVTLDEDSYHKAKNGIPIIVPIPVNSYMDQYVRLKNTENILFGIGKVENDRIRIERLLLWQE
jgi:tRNA pseudouridine55 synthase